MHTHTHTRTTMKMAHQQKPTAPTLTSSPESASKRQMPPQHIRPDGILRSASGSVRAMVKMFERENTPESTSTCPRPVGKLRSASTPVPEAMKDLVPSSGEEGIKHMADKVGFSSQKGECDGGRETSLSVRREASEQNHEIEHSPDGKETATNLGCVTAAAEEGGDAEDAGDECSSVYSQYSEADGTTVKGGDDKDGLVPLETASPSNSRTPELEKDTNHGLDNQDKDSSYELQPSTPKARPIQIHRCLPTSLTHSPSNKPHTQALPTPPTTLLSDPQPGPQADPLPLSSRDPAAAAF